MKQPPQAHHDLGDLHAVEPRPRRRHRRRLREPPALEAEPPAAGVRAAARRAARRVAGNSTRSSAGRPCKLFGGNKRRAVYGYVDRLEFPSLLTTFDVPNPAGLTPERTNTTVAPQALFLMNGPFARDAAKKLVALPAMQKLTDPGDRLDRCT